MGFSSLLFCFFFFLAFASSIDHLHFLFLFDVEQWFKGGTTNISYNCLDRNVQAGLGDKIALYWEGNEPGFDASLTYTQLLNSVCQVNFLSTLAYAPNLHFCFF